MADKSNSFTVAYSAGGEIDKVKKVKDVEYVEEIKNFAQLSQPYNKMVAVSVPAMEGTYIVEWTSPNVPAELLAIVVTCSGYGEDDYYNLYVNDILWFDTWYPTEVKEGLYIGTSTYVYKMEPETKFRLEFHNESGTSKKVWLGVRTLVKKGTDFVARPTDPNALVVPEPTP